MNIDTKFELIKHLIEHSDEIARGCILYTSAVDALIESIRDLECTIEACRVPNKK